MGKIYRYDGIRCCDSCGKAPDQFGKQSFGKPILYKGCKYYACPDCKKAIKQLRKEK